MMENVENYDGKIVAEPTLCINCGKETDGSPFCIDDPEAPYRTGRGTSKSLCCVDHLKTCDVMAKTYKERHGKVDFIEQYLLCKDEWIAWLAQ